MRLHHNRVRSSFLVFLRDGAEAFAGKTVIDINNPVDIENFLTTRDDGRSLTEAIADALPDAKVGKAFNMAQVKVWEDPDMTYDGRQMVVLYTSLLVPSFVLTAVLLFLEIQ